MTISTDEERAYCAAAWASGTGQREIGRWFGYSSGAMISVAIGDFIEKYSPEVHARSVEERIEGTWRWKTVTRGKFGPDRKLLVKDALARFVKVRD